MCGPLAANLYMLGKLMRRRFEPHGLYDVHSRMMRWSPVLIEWDDDIDTKQLLGLSNRSLACSIKTHPPVV